MEFNKAPSEMPKFALMADGEQVGWSRTWNQWEALARWNEVAERLGWRLADEVEEIHE